MGWTPDACPNGGTRTIRATTYAAIFARFMSCTRGRPLLSAAGVFCSPSGTGQRSDKHGSRIRPSARRSRHRRGRGVAVDQAFCPGFWQRDLLQIRLAPVCASTTRNKRIIVPNIQLARDAGSCLRRAQAPVPCARSQFAGAVALQSAPQPRPATRPAPPADRAAPAVPPAG
jgi:hypothetical protein